MAVDGNTRMKDGVEEVVGGGETDGGEEKEVKDKWKERDERRKRAYDKKTER